MKCEIVEKYVCCGYTKQDRIPGQHKTRRSPLWLWKNLHTTILYKLVLVGTNEMKSWQKEFMVFDMEEWTMLHWGNCSIG